jgi:hypothetical protein
MPVPAVEPLTEPFWTAARDGRLVIQRCSACGRFRHLPHPLCAVCQSSDHDWVESAGDGRVFTYTIVAHPVHAATVDVVPYNVVVVELDDCGNVLVPGNVVDCPPGEVAVDLPVSVVFDVVSAEIAIPRFRRRSPE